MIEYIKLKNFKKFRNQKMFFDSKINILIGDNGAGKSSILWIISCVLNGSYSQIEKVGIESLFNVGVVSEFVNKESEEKRYNDLPVLSAEIFFKDKELDNYEIHGVKNSTERPAYGLKLEILPNENYTNEIMKVLEESTEFPFEFYKVEFTTFSGKAYSSFSKKHNSKHELIDTSVINTNYSIKRFIQRLYNAQADILERQKINHDFRKLGNNFSEKIYTNYNMEGRSVYKIAVDTSKDSSFINSITALKDGIPLYNLGQGENIMLSVDSTINNFSEMLDIILIEEPENHLSYLNMKKLISLIEKTKVEQLIITTHSNMIAARLGLKNVTLMHDSSNMNFKDLSKETSLFFEKAPDNNLLNFILGNKVILVEGDAEFILMEKFYKIQTGVFPFEDNVTIISCGGKTFKRYLEISERLNKKVLVITDNDKDYNKNIENVYSKYKNNDSIKIQADQDNDKHTFEVVLYQNNKKFFEDQIATNNMSEGVQKFMLHNKTEAAMRLLNEIQENRGEGFSIPKYIEEGIDWIRE